MSSAPTQGAALLQPVLAAVRSGFDDSRQILSFEGWLDLLAAHPARHARNAAQFVWDCLQHFGTQTIETPAGRRTRHRLFDCPWENGADRVAGQESAQDAIVHALENFVRAGRVGRLILLHGPSGSAKSSLVSCLQRALEHYSRCDEGAMYTFSWVFPTTKVSRKPLGFGGAAAERSLETYAFLDDEELDSKLDADLADHPILLLPKPQRKKILDALGDREGGPRWTSEHIAEGDLSPRSRQIFDALLSQYRGDLERVLRHVRVERLHLSRRYRRGLASVEPQLQVDAGVRMVTQDQRLARLPPSLQNLSLHEPYGDLVDANRGVIEYNDLLEKPMESYKYLLSTTEKSSVALHNCILFLDVVFVATANEEHFAGLKQHPYFASFKGRLDLVRVPYLLNFKTEQEIYDAQMTRASVGKPIAPHATWVAAFWAVLTRLNKPIVENYPAAVREAVNRLNPVQKALLYANGEVPGNLPIDQQRELKAHIGALWEEGEADGDFEGRSGASPREMKAVLLHAAHDVRYKVLSPFAVLDAIEDVVLKNPSVHRFVSDEPKGEFRHHERLLERVRELLFDRIDADVLDAMGLAKKDQYAELFARYVLHVSHWQRGEKIRNAITGAHEDPDLRFLDEMESDLRRDGSDKSSGDKSSGVKSQAAFRGEVISRIGSWALDHPGEGIPYEELFPRLFEQMRHAFHERQKGQVKSLKDALLKYFTDGPGVLGEPERGRVGEMLSALLERYGYDEGSARDAVVALLRARY